LKFELKFAISARRNNGSFMLCYFLTYIWYRWRLTKCCFRSVEKRKV